VRRKKPNPKMDDDDDDVTAERTPKMGWGPYALKLK